jgi:hypothetical protein
MKKQIAAALAAMFVMSTATAVLAAPVSDLTDKATFNGDIRVRYDMVDTNGVDNDTAKFRTRINTKYQLTEKMDVSARFVVGENKTTDDAGLDNGFDLYTLNYKGEQFGFSLGRQDATLSFAGLAANTTDTDGKGALKYKGLKSTAKFDDITLAVYNGEFDQDAGASDTTQSANIYSLTAKLGDVNAGVGQVNYKTGEYLSIFADTTIGAAKIGAEFVDNSDTDGSAWKVKLAYGAAKKGEFLYEADYRDVDANAMLTSTSKQAGTADYTQWSVGVSTELDKNVVGKLYYEVKEVTTDTKTLRAEVVAKF